MDEKSLADFKQKICYAIGVEKEQEFIIWVLQSTHHILNDYHMELIHTKAKELTKNNKSITSMNKLTELPIDLYNNVGSYLDIQDSRNLAGTNKGCYLQIQTIGYLNNLVLKNHLVLYPQLLNALLSNRSNPHLAGAPQTIKLIKFTKYDKWSHGFWTSLWCQRLFKRVSKIEIYDDHSLLNLGLGGISSLFYGGNHRIINEFIIGGLHKGNFIISLFISYCRHLFGKYCRNKQKITQIKCLSIDTYGTRCDWSNFLILMHTCNYNHLILNHTRVTIPKIFHSKLVKLSVTSDTVFDHLDCDKIDDLCKLEEVNINMADVKRFNCKQIIKLLRVMRKYHVVAAKSVCNLGIKTEDAFDVAYIEEISKLWIEIIIFHCFENIIVNINDNDELDLLSLFFISLRSINPKNVKTIIFQIHLAEEDFPLTISDDLDWQRLQTGERHDDLPHIRFEVNWKEIRQPIIGLVECKMEYVWLINRNGCIGQQIYVIV